MPDTPGPEKPAGPTSRPAKHLGDWKSLHLWQIQGVRDVLVVLGVLGLLWLGQKISIVTVPLLLAILFAYLFEPVIRWVMSRTNLSRQSAVSAVLAATILAIVVPASLGLAFGIIQSASLVNKVAENTGTTLAAVKDGAQLREARAALSTLRPPEESAEVPQGASDENEATDQPADTDDADPTTGPETDPSSQPDPSTQNNNANDTEPATDSGTTAPQDSGIPLTEAQTAAIVAAEDEVTKWTRTYNDSLAEVDQAGKAYRFVADHLYDEDDGETLTNALTSVQAWLKANAEEIASAGAGAVRSTINFFGSVFSLLFMAFITAFFFFFLATGWVEVQAFGAKLVPDKHRDMTFDLLGKFDAVISAFIRGRLTIAFIQSIVFTVGYLVIGVPAAFILGPIVALLSIVPYLALVGLPISALLLALEGHAGFRGEWWWYLGAPTAIYFLGQSLDDYVWTPLIQGKGTDMSTPMILFASLAGGALFGVFGLLIAIPIAACLKILIQEVFWPRFKDWAEGREQDFLPIDRT